MGRTNWGSAILVIMAAGIGILAILYLTGSSEKLAQAIYNLWTTNPLTELYAQYRNALQGSPVSYVSAPSTPEGYSPSNWIWERDGVKIGLPAGMTFTEFCKGSPDSPMCKGVWT